VTPPGGRRVVIVGGGFAGLGCAKRLAKHRDVNVTLLDRNNYHQFLPLLYQVATSQLAAGEIAFSLRKLFRNRPNVEVKMTDVRSIDPEAGIVTDEDGRTWAADAIVLAAGSRPNYFGTPGAEEHAFPLYSYLHATWLRSRILAVFEAADRDPTLIERGALNFVIVGGGATGVETAGALADMIARTMTAEYHHLEVHAARIHLVDLGHHLLGPFSPKAHEYAERVLRERGVELHLDTKVAEVAPGHVKLGDGTEIKTRCVVWAGGIQAPELAATAGVPQGRGGRIDVKDDLTVEGFPNLYVVGDVANIPGPDGKPLPQLGSVALQAGVSAADNLLADFAGHPAKPFKYKDKGIMAMIGRNSAIAAMGPRRREVHGLFAFAAWLGVHAILMTGIRNRIQTFVDWAWSYFSVTRGPQNLDRTEATEIDWSTDGATPSVTTAAK